MTIETPDVADVTAGYLTCALWASTDDAGHPLDDSHDADDVYPASVAEAEAFVRAFINANAADCAEAYGEATAYAGDDGRIYIG